MPFFAGLFLSAFSDSWRTGGELHRYLFAGILSGPLKQRHHRSQPTLKTNLLGYVPSVTAPSLRFPEAKDDRILSVVSEGDFKEDLIAGVKKLGLDLDVISRSSPLTAGIVIGVSIDKTGRRRAVRNPNSGPGVALAY